jgi:phage tail sheath protein FI
MPDFLHGVETIEVPQGSRPIRGVKTAVVGLVGTAPIHHVGPERRRVNEPVLILSDVAAAQFFGPEIPGYTIPQALRAGQSQGGGIYIVVNVFDPAEHNTISSPATLPIEDGRIALEHGDIISASVREDDEAVADLVEGVDYALDRITGVIRVLDGGALEEAESAFVTYTRGDPTFVTPGDIIGGVDSETGARTGAQAFLDSFSRFGFFPKILEAPVYSTLASVVAALDVLAQQDRCRAIWLADAPVGTTFQEAVEGRGPQGEINFNTSSERGVLLFPHLKAYDRARDEDVLEPYSQFMAGVIAATDLRRGFWVSPSNKPIRGIVGVEIPVSAAINDPNSEANTLNSVGITTVFNAFGSGLRTWGNRSAAFPASSAAMSFIQSRRTADQIHESLELAMLDFIDEPITPAIIEAVLDSGNGYMRLLIGRRAIPPGSRVEFNDAKNPPEQIAAGHLRFDIVFIPNPPAERITFESHVDISLLQR